MRIEHVKSGMVLAQDVLDDQGNLLLEKGIALTEVYISRLRNLGIRSIQIVDNFTLSQQHPAIAPALREELRSCFSAVFRLRTEEILEHKMSAAYREELSQTIDSVIQALEPRIPDIMNLQIRNPRPEEEDHAVNVCLLSLVTGLYLKFPHSVLHNLALGALLHDIGKMLLPAVQGRLTNSPRMHTLYGRELLIKNKMNLTVARMAAEHHEAYDGSGYPLGLSGKALHPLSRLVAIANYFDNHMQAAAANGSSYQEVAEKMMAAGNTLFDLNLLKAFFRTIAIYPIGSLIRLSTGQIAHVVKNRTHFPLRPLVRLQDNGDEIDLVRKPSIIIQEVLHE